MTQLKKLIALFLISLITLSPLTGCNKPFAAVATVDVISHTMILDANGTLWNWGPSYKGQLCNDTTGWNYTTTPTKVMNHVINISGESGNITAVQSDGSLWVWQFSNIEKTTPEGKPFIIKPKKVLDNVASAYVYGLSLFAIKKDGTLWVWGSNSYGVLGLRSTDWGNASSYPRDPKTEFLEIPVKVMDHVKFVSSLWISTLVLKTDGSLWMFGGQVKTPTKMMDDVIATSNGGKTWMAIKTDGSLWAWGANKFGQLGDGTKQDREQPAKIMEDVRTITNGVYSWMAIKNDGSLWMWGANKFGQLGDGTKQDRYRPVKILGDVKSVSTNGSTLAIKTDGSLWTWGAASPEPYKDGSINTLIPVKMMDNVTSACVQGLGVQCIKSDGSVYNLQGGNDRYLVSSDTASGSLKVTHVS